MTNEEHDLTPESELSSAAFDTNEDDLRYAPPAEVITSEPSEHDQAVPADVVAIPPITEPAVQVASDSLPVNVTDGLDIEAALAAVSTLSDVIAEQEAAELSRIAKIEAEEQAKVERQARMDNPERFFQVPPLTTLKRGQLATLIPALWLIGLGGWLTFTLTASKTAQIDTTMLIVAVLVGLGLSLIARWINSRRWATGSLFFGLLALIVGALFFYLQQPTSPGLINGWPLFFAAIGIAGLLTRFLGSQIGIGLPSLMLIVAGLAGSITTVGLLSANITSIAATLWPVAVLIILVIWILPLVFRQRQ